MQICRLIKRTYESNVNAAIVASAKYTHNKKMIISLLLSLAQILIGAINKPKVRLRDRETVTLEIWRCDWRVAVAAAQLYRPFGYASRVNRRNIIQTKISGKERKSRFHHPFRSNRIPFFLKHLTDVNTYQQQAYRLAEPQPLCDSFRFLIKSKCKKGSESRKCRKYIHRAAMTRHNRTNTYRILNF